MKKKEKELARLQAKAVAYWKAWQDAKADVKRLNSNDSAYRLAWAEANISWAIFKVIQITGEWKAP